MIAILTMAYTALLELSLSMAKSCRAILPEADADRIRSPWLSSCVLTTQWRRKPSRCEKRCWKLSIMGREMGAGESDCSAGCSGRH